QTIWVACRNDAQPNGTKTWDLVLTSTGLPGDINDIVMVDGSGVGFDKAGGAIKPAVPGAGYDLNKGTETIHMSFSPCPDWERVAIKNKGNIALTFTIVATYECLYPTLSAHTLSVERLTFGAEAGAI